MSGPKDFAETYVTRETLDAECARWMDDLAPFRWREVEPLRKNSAALLVVDMTKPFVDEGQPLATANARAIVPRVAELVAAFRAAEAPVIWLVQGHHSVAHDRGHRLSGWWTTPILQGTDDVHLAKGLEFHPDEKMIYKRRYSGFHASDLELTLRCLNIHQVVVAGVLTPVCVFGTALDAFERDFVVYVPPDATAAHARELHLAALKTLSGWCAHVVPAREMIAMLRETS